MTRTLEMFSCRLALTRASARRTTWKARREWVRQYAVTISTSGTHHAGQSGKVGVHGEQDDQDAHQGQRVAEDAQDAAGEEVLQGAHVVLHARHQAAHGLAVVKRRVEPHEVPEQRLSQPQQHALRRAHEQQGLAVLQAPAGQRVAEVEQHDDGEGAQGLPRT